MPEHSDTTTPRGARALVLAASAAALVPWLLLCLVMLGFSGMCTDDHDQSDCSAAVELPILLGVTGVALAIVQAVFAVRGTTRASVLLRAAPVLAAAPIAVLCLVAANLG